MNSKSNILTAFAVFSLVAVLAFGLGSIDVEAGDGDALTMPEKVTVTYVVGASSTAESVSVSEGKALLRTDCPVIVPAGFIFGGWSETENDNSKPITEITLKTQTTTEGTVATTSYITEYTVHAILLPDHTADPFTITYVIPDHADVVVTVPMGTAFPVMLLTPADFGTYGISVPLDKVFKGWFADPTSDAPVESVGAEATKITAETGPIYTLDDVVVYAVYEGNAQVSVTWQIDGAETVETVYIGQQIAHETPAKDGYIFCGWVEVNGETETPIDEFPTATKNVVYKATFEAVPEPTPEPVPEKDDSGMTAILAILGVVIVIGGALFVWTLKKDKKV